MGVSELSVAMAGEDIMRKRCGQNPGVSADNRQKFQIGICIQIVVSNNIIKVICRR